MGYKSIEAVVKSLQGETVEEFIDSAQALWTRAMHRSVWIL